MSKQTFSFSLGNAALLPSEEGLVQFVNSRLQASATRHHKRFNHDYDLKVETVQVGGITVRRAAPVNGERVVIPLASAST